MRGSLLSGQPTGNVVISAGGSVISDKPVLLPVYSHMHLGVCVNVKFPMFGASPDAEM